MQWYNKNMLSGWHFIANPSGLPTTGKYRSFYNEILTARNKCTCNALILAFTYIRLPILFPMVMVAIHKYSDQIYISTYRCVTSVNAKIVFSMWI